MGDQGEQESTKPVWIGLQGMGLHGEGLAVPPATAYKDNTATDTHLLYLLHAE